MLVDVPLIITAFLVCKYLSVHTVSYFSLSSAGVEM